MTQEPNMKPKKREDITQQELGEEAMLYDSRHEKVHILNHTAYFIWKLCDGDHTLKDIREEMIKQFPESSEPEITKDIKSTIDNFDNNKLILQ